jgi:hypothetical protein
MLWMRRTLPIALLALAAAAPPAAASAPATAAVPPDAARARLVACHTGADAPSRYLTAEAVMRSLRSGDHMELRFDLFRRATRVSRAIHVGGPGLGTWNDATPRVARFRFRKTIANLPSRAQYRVAVRYRWLNGAGQTFAYATRRTPWCAQPDPRPDLRPVTVTSAPGPGANRTTYFVLVRNEGHSPAGPFDVELAVDGAPQPAVTVDGLAAGERRTVAIVGRDCSAGGSLDVTVDPDDRVDESDEADDRASFPCP